MRAIVLSFGFISLFAGVATADDWMNYTNHGKMSGVVSKGETDKIVLQVPALEKNKNNNSGGHNRRPSLKVGHDDVDIHYAPGALVRWVKLPNGPDGKAPTGKALESLKLPLGVPGFAAERTDLHAGQIVELHLVRPREITAAKATEKDILIKYVMIEGESKAAKPAAKDEPKKKN